MRRLISRSRRGAVGLAILLMTAGLASAQSAPEPAPNKPPDPGAQGLAAPAASRAGIAYRVEIEGVSDSRLKALLTSVSELVQRQDQKPLSRAALERRASDDVQRLRATLSSESYYAAELRTQIDFAAIPVKVRIQIEPNVPFRVVVFEIRYREAPANAASDLPRDSKALGLPIGSLARAADIRAAESALLDALRKKGYPKATIAEQRYLVDLSAHIMRVALVVDLGGYWVFGPVAIEGASSVEENFIERRKPWAEGERFDIAKLDSYRRLLEGTSLFRRVQVVASDEPPTGHALPVRVLVEERKHRTIGIGAKYATNEGFGGRVFWQHRNLSGRGRTLDLAMTGAQIRQALEADYRRPEFRRLDQTLVLGATIANERTDAFDEVGFRGSVGVERRIIKPLLLSLGVETQISRIEDNTSARTNELLVMPLVSTWDSSNDLLDPTRGVRARLRVAPALGNNDGFVSFVTTEATVAGYIGLLERPETVLALRARLGAITGENTDDIPANRRFYGGGGGSVRSFGFRDLGPLDADDDPLGGRSVVEAGAEFRIRVAKSFGVVPFVEAGNVYDGSVPDFDDGVRWGAGLGLRYYSAIGPFRVDVAFPFNRRDGVDSRFQIYISLGQAF